MSYICCSRYYFWDKIIWIEKKKKSKLNEYEYFQKIKKIKVMNVELEIIIIQMQ
jgi:hypothetical protein